MRRDRAPLLDPAVAARLRRPSAVQGLVIAGSRFDVIPPADLAALVSAARAVISAFRGPLDLAAFRGPSGTALRLLEAALPPFADIAPLPSAPSSPSSLLPGSTTSGQSDCAPAAGGEPAGAPRPPASPDGARPGSPAAELIPESGATSPAPGRPPGEACHAARPAVDVTFGDVRHFFASGGARLA